MSDEGRRMKRGKEIFWNVLTAVVGIMLISMVASKLLIGWSSIFTYRVFYIMSESMEPVISEHQMVVGRLLAEDEELKAGEIYAYRRKGPFGTEIIIHRLTQITEDGKYRFQGDNNALPDEVLVDRENIGYKIQTR